VAREATTARRRRPEPAVPPELVAQVRAALAEVDDARAEVARVDADHAALHAHRQAHARLRTAFDRADALLRAATAAARQRSFREGSLWRGRLVRLDTARQAHLLAEQDERIVLPLGSVRALDTGMSGPAIGDRQHGRSRPPGARPGYGLDVDAVLAATAVAGEESQRRS
jgi:hypothetical protein